MKEIITPTGKIITIRGESFGKNLEVVVVSDYGKEKNIKADFLGLPDKVHRFSGEQTNPMTDKLVVTICSQYGCSMGCRFCDVPKVGSGRNVSLRYLIHQIACGIRSSGVRKTNRLNIHVARMGEPLFNTDVLRCFNKTDIEFVLDELGFDAGVVHPVISTMLPKSIMPKTKLNYLREWCRIKNEEYNGEAGLQFSINSTSPSLREWMFNGNATTLEDISVIAALLPKPIGRKYTLNFALAGGFILDPKLIKSLFNPSDWICKITPIHETTASKESNISTGYDYTRLYDTEQELVEAGFDVIVFVPSVEEEVSRITCGNAILADKGEV